MSAETKVGSLIRIVPDGLTADGKNARISLVLMPDPTVSKDDPDTVELANWPSEVAAKIREQAAIEIIAALYDRPQFTEIQGVKLASSAYDSAASDRLWTRIFSDGLKADQIPQLYEALKTSFTKASAAQTPILSRGATQYGPFLEELTARIALKSAGARVLKRAKVGSGASADVFTGQVLRNVIAPAFFKALPSLTPGGAITDHGPSLPEIAQEILQKLVGEQAAYLARAKGSAKVAGPTGVGPDADLLDKLLAHVDDTAELLWSGPSKARITAKNGLPDASRILLRHRIAMGLLDVPIKAAKQVNSDAVNRKFNAILTQPSLAASLGLIFDIEIPFNAFLSFASSKGFLIGARIKGLATSTPLVTATEISKIDSDTYFGPTSQYVVQGAVDPSAGGAEQASLRQGFLDLRAMSAVDKGRGRYIISSLDTLSAIEKMDQKGKTVIGQIVQGQPIPQDEVLPELRTLGLSLLDACQDLSMRAQSEPLKQVSDADGLDWKILHAEELCSGFRFDVGVVPRSSNVPVHLSLTEKIITYKERTPIKSTEPSREDGFSRPLLRQSGIELGIVAETLLVYRGDNLAVPVRTGKEREEGRIVYDDPARSEVITEHDAAVDLSVEIQVKIPVRGDSERLDASGRPPVRFGKRIAAINARCRWLNGGGHTLRSAQTAYSTNKYSLNSRLLIEGQPEEPYVHQRFEEIVAPIVLLDEQDRLVKMSDVQLGSFPGNAPEMIVLREDATYEQRYLLPGQISIDLAEQHGVFDRLNVADRGGLESFDREASTGRFPQALGGARAQPIDYYGQNDKVPGRNRYKFRETLAGGKPGPITVTARGPVLRRRVQSVPQGADIAYYPDPLAECVFLALRRGAEDASGGPTGMSPRLSVPFNPRKTWPAGAVPVQVRLTRSSEADVRNGVQWRITTSTTTVAGVKCPTIAIAIAPGEEFDLLLWCGPSNADLLKEHWLPSYVAHKAIGRANLLQARSDRTPAEDVELAGHAVFQILSGGSDTFGTKAFADGKPSITEVLNIDPIAHLNGWRTIKLCRPVEKPNKKPEIISRNGKAQLHAVRIRTAKDGAPANRDSEISQDIVEQRWHAYLEAHNNGDLPPKTDPIPYWASEENATRAYFLGRIAFDRLSTSELICLGRWVDHVDDSKMVRRNEEGRWTFQPPDPKSLDPTPLFKISGIPNDNLALDPLEEAETLEDGTGRRSYDFGDTRARRLLVSTIAASRFDTYFKKGEADSRRFQVESDNQIELWIDATRRPAPLSLFQPDMLPVFKFTSQPLIASDGKGTVTGFKVTMDGQCRVKINRPCIDTGEGEMIALALAPSDLGKLAHTANRCGIQPDDQRDVPSPDQLNDYDAAIASSAEPFLLRRGHDAKRISGSYENGLKMVVPSDVGACSDDWSAAPLWMPFTPPNDTNSSVPEQAALVSVVGFKPSVDPATGEYWYVDFPIATGPSYWPYVRCGLLRWQPHAIEHHELSTPVVAWGNIPPRRIAEVRFLDGGIDESDGVELTFSGVGFTEANLGPRFPADAGGTIRPLLNVRLVRREEGGGWAPATDPRLGEEISQYDLSPQIANSEARWTTTIQLPFKRSSVPFGLLIEEYAQMPELTSAANTSADPKLVEQLRYACVLDFATGEAKTEE